MASPEGRPAKRPARESLLEAAARLFYSDGVAATGIDSITAAAGVAKKSLYNNFASKADLVAAYLAARHEEWLALYRERAAAAVTPQDRVLAVFDAYIDHANFAYEHGFRGCGLLNAAAELPAGAPGRQGAVGSTRKKLRASCSSTWRNCCRSRMRRRAGWPGIWRSCSRGQWRGPDLKAETAACMRPG